MKYFIFSLVILLTGCADPTIKQLKSGEKTLYCYFNDGYRKVEPNKIVDRHPDGVGFIFTNGSARQCEIK